MVDWRASTYEIAQLHAENERLYQALYDIVATQPLWNGGVAPHKADYLYQFIDELRDIARAALAHKEDTSQWQAPGLTG